MRDDHEVEKDLKGFEHRPDDRVKKAVMSAFKREINATGADGNRANFWRRPVPLYAAAVFVIVMMGLSYVAGKRSLESNSGSLAPGQSRKRALIFPHVDCATGIMQ